jgi:phospholipase A1
MPFTHNTKGNAQSLTGVGSQSELDQVEDEEIKFQISMKLPLWQQAFNTDTDLYFAFTGTAWWQAYADDISSPFRDTNYEPELFFRHIGGPEIFGVKTAFWDIGLNHQSNGRGDPLSRSWNRVIGAAGFDLGDFAVGLRAWYRIPEDDDEDDNPHMHRYYGYGDVRVGWAPNKNTVTAMVRPGTEKGAYEVTWSYQLTDTLRLYTQYFNGYGESLLDYNQRTERIGFGIALSDFIERRR